MNASADNIYQDYAVESLVYAHQLPSCKGLRKQRRYLAAVVVTNVATRAARVTKLEHDFEYFGDARRAAEAQGRLIVDGLPSGAGALELGNRAQGVFATPFSDGQSLERARASDGENPFSDGAPHRVLDNPVEPRPGDTGRDGAPLS